MEAGAPSEALDSLSQSTSAAARELKAAAEHQMTQLTAHMVATLRRQNVGAAQAALDAQRAEAKAQAAALLEAAARDRLALQTRLDHSRSP